METNNLTPDENLKNPVNYNPYEDYDEIIHPLFRDTLNDVSDGECVVIGAPSEKEDLAETGTILVLLFVVIFILVVGIILYYLLQP